MFILLILFIDLAREELAPLLHSRVPTKRRRFMTNENERQILAKVKQGLQPPTQEEINDVTARWLFGRHAQKIMKYAPWSFVLMKLMWKKGEEPWQS